MCRKRITLAICLVALAFGCEKKEPEKKAPVVTVTPTFATPAGMVAIQEGVPLFISKKPVSIGQYLRYLEDTGQPAPDRLRNVKPDSPGASLPVMGLTRKQAERYATWSLARLPTRQEWSRAASVIGVRPYPWPTDEQDCVAVGEIYTFRDWPDGSPGEAAARRAKGRLLDDILSDHKERIARLRERLQEALNNRQASAAQQWQQLKPALFALLDKEKKAAELSARNEAEANVLEILGRLAAAKAELAVKLKTGNLTEEQAKAEIEAYNKMLATHRTEAARARRSAEERSKQLQDQVVAVTRQLERQLAALASPAGLQGARDALNQSEGEPQDIADAARIEGLLEAAAAQLAQAPPVPRNLPDAGQVAARSAELDKQMKQHSGEDEAAARIADLKQKIKDLDEAIGQSFLQEKLFLQDLDELIPIRARMKAIEAHARALSRMLGRPQGGAE